MKFIKRNSDLLVVSGLVFMIAVGIFVTVQTKKVLAEGSVTKTFTATTTGTLTLTKQFAASGGSTLECWTMGWTSSDKGNAGGYSDDIAGTIERVVWNPGAVAPSANYDVTLTDQDGLDLLNGTGANRHTSNTEGSVCMESDGTSYNKMTFVGRVTLAVANAGDSKNGVMRLYIRR